MHYARPILNSLAHFRTVLLFITYRPKKKVNSGVKKVLFLDISRNYHSRYLYLFLKFFELEGYTIYLPKNLRILHHLRSDHYASYLLQERIVNFGNPPKHSAPVYINEDQLSPDFFTDNSNGLSPRDLFHVPMTQHPLMYRAGFWNEPLKDRVRKRSVFMAGNFDAVQYRKIGEDGIFKLLSRIAVYEYLDSHNMLFKVKDQQELESFLKGRDDNRKILINRLLFDIPMPDLRQLLGSFDFYFALPGVVIPVSHNIIEAMSAGSIPFIQKTYADMFNPSLLDNVNAITFENEEDMELKVRSLYSIPEERVGEMRKNVLDYYKQYLTPGSVVKKIAASGFKKIYLQAEHHSVELLKKRLSSLPVVKL
jgi:hypothetical protein